ncbi:hypothetical protein ONS96_014876 [Cadophora gregata f. sp. sojae]|nr:hypothetical protein ONS96_014876 [Cadophora gregata f. sp. sojae]
MAQHKEMLICIDFGMTGSARWRDNQPEEKWTQQEIKTPTTLEYDAKGNLISWGTPATNPYNKFVECFKTYIGSGPIPDFPDAPKSRQEVFRWFEDYLTAICKQTTEEIDKVNHNWREGNIIWNFTVPGCWLISTAIRDFTLLAEDAVYSCLPSTSKEDIRINTDLTEGQASAQCLLSDSTVARCHKLAIGDMVISCDIGGATTDIAISTISEGGELITAPQLTFIPEGLRGR